MGQGERKLNPFLFKIQEGGGFTRQGLLSEVGMQRWLPKTESSRYKAELTLARASLEIALLLEVSITLCVCVCLCFFKANKSGVVPGRYINKR